MSASNVPSPHIEITRLDGSDLTIFMSFGLLNKLSAMVGDLRDLPNIYMVPELQDAMIYEVLVPRTEQGKAIQEYTLYGYSDQLSPEQGEALLKWCEEHITSFFLKRLQAAQALQQRLIQTMKG
ncbi:MAG: hypothetical protein PHE38_12300 [Alishewanella agri]|nr:hypothetical protein [Alishewanella agri]